MSALAEKLDLVKEQVARFVREHQQLREQLSAREQQAREHQRMLTELQERISGLERENEVLRKGVGAAEGGAQAPGSKERIDQLVAEIDRCLELLGP